ncbi:MAG: PPOX class F420-dependent oxidoreductase [Actinomycetota bacterium]
MPVPTPSSARAVIESGRIAHLVTLNADGSPHVSCAWVGLEDEEVVIGTLHDQPKLRNVRRDPRVALSIEADRRNEWGLDEYLVIRGAARVTEGGAPELLQRLAHVYLGPDVVFPAMPDPPPGFVTRIAIERIGGLGPWAAPSG